MTARTGLAYLFHFEVNIVSSLGMHTLSLNQVIPERVFTHPDHVFYDQRLLAYMARRICILFETGQATPHHPRMSTLSLVEPDGRSHRIILARPKSLFTAKSLTVVGFFGQRRVEGIEHLPMDSTDHQLVQTMREHEGLFSYSTQELTCGNFVNLVMFRDEEAKNFWGTCPVHARFAREISPQYYYTVRIYNGLLADGLTHPDQLNLQWAKYYDYQNEGVWMAARRLQGAGVS